ncbi:TetR/AcrR family transcriptional regulator [Bifidobacterium eulemuris]|uniref:TetR-type transcriptional regulator n=1 Tax=Bifidobacterium eulemuris TaxID=1765219 RepID=A0A261GDJ2_9BIFI|nr:TetR/AcrR family transcriptional regulator [Bifidobacterium eulemuris]OZG69484.1 TetR-type transcriptional regulator [Bifidobacterium eulemuris]QOL32157.1 TetR/AcrR family transcriptional regulator [Bifidobacterium eulemuris]
MTTTHPTPAPPSPRCERTREATDRKIVQATLQIATSKGIGGVTIEEVARVSGVAKTTIYRRYRNADDLLGQVRSWQLDGLQDPGEFKATQADFARMMSQVVRRFDSGIGIKAVGIVLSSDGEFFQGILDQVVMPAKARLSEYVRRGEQEGALRHGIDVDFLFGTIVGSMIACETLHGKVDDAWGANISALVWPSIAA